MHRISNRKSVIALIATVVFLLGVLATIWVTRLESQRAYQQYHSLVLSQASTMRAKLEQELNSTLFLTRGLVAYVSLHPDITSQEFDRLAAKVIEDGQHIRNIGLAPNNVIRYVYPLAGNEAAVGLNYLEQPAQRAAVLRAIELGHTVVAGPVKLVQGGVAFINRTPIYVGDTPGKRHYWGLASVVLDMDSVFEAAGLTTEVNGTRYALRGKDGLGSQGAVFFGDPKLFGADAVLLPITLPEGSWQLAALPAGGWERATSHLPALQIIGGLLALTLALLVYITLSERRQTHMLAIHDPLTGLPNRRYFVAGLQQALERAARHHGRFALLYVDLDDFKPVNDNYGHRAGDAVLIEVAARLQEALRQIDTVARVGGDEFMVILDGTGELDSAGAVARKLIARIGAPIMIGGATVHLGASIGISRYPVNGTAAEELIRKADDAMYAAKAEGKHRFASAPEAAPAGDEQRTGT